MNFTIEKIDGGPSLHVSREGDDSIWWLVMDPESTHPSVVSIPRSAPYWSHKKHLKADGRLYNQIMKAVQTQGVFLEAVREFERTQDRYDEFGAADTEPRTEFTLMLDRVANGETPNVPVTVRKWQLFSDKKSGEAARALTKAAREVVKAAKQDRTGFAQYMADTYGVRL